MPKTTMRGLAHAISRRLPARADGGSKAGQTLPVLIEFQSPSAAFLASPTAPGARNVVRIVSSMFGVFLLALAVIPVDRVVTARGKVISVAPTMVVQPLETSIIRSIEVREGQVVHAGDLLARLDPTFVAADAGALDVQVAALEAEVARLKAEAADQPYVPAPGDAAGAQQETLYKQRQAERQFKFENFTQKITGLEAAVTKSEQEAATGQQRLAVARKVEGMRKRLEKDGVGSTLNTLAATTSRIEVEADVARALNTAEAARRELAAMSAERDGYDQNWRVDVSQQLTERSAKLNDAREALNKAGRRRELTELRAERDGTVLTVAKASAGSVVQSGDQLITMAPAGDSMELEANVEGLDGGFVHDGADVAIKFDTFPFAQYGLAYGKVRTMSADTFTAQDEARSRAGWAGSVPVAGNSVEPYYRARITLDRIKLRNLPPHFVLSPGMPATADIKVGKRTILSYLLGKIIQVGSEGMREP